MESKNNDKPKETTSYLMKKIKIVFIIGFIYVFFLTFRFVAYIIPEHFNDIYKPIKYALKECDYDQTDYKVIYDSEGKEIRYIIKAKTWYFDSVVNLLVKYLKDNPENKCNDGYRITIEFSKERGKGSKDRGTYDLLYVKNYFDGSLHDDFDVIYIPVYGGLYGTNRFCVGTNIRYKYLLIYSPFNRNDLTTDDYMDILENFKDFETIYVNMYNDTQFADFKSSLQSKLQPLGFNGEIINYVGEINP
jgi:hypothetical protein